MIPLLIAIVVLGVSILISKQCIRINNWYIWACMLTETYMKGKPEGQKLEVLMQAGRHHFPMIRMMIPKSIFRRFIYKVKQGLMDHDHEMKNYNRLVQGVALYNKDYTFLMRLIEDEGKIEEA